MTSVQNRHYFFLFNVGIMVDYFLCTKWVTALIKLKYPLFFSVAGSLGENRPGLTGCIRGFMYNGKAVELTQFIDGR